MGLTHLGAAAWRVRISGGGRGSVAGAGVVVGPGTVLTCAHVVAAALRRPPGREAPEAVVGVGFPGVEGAGTVGARVAEGGWLRAAPAGDLAVLVLEGALPAGVEPAPLRRRSGDEAGYRVSAFGHPDAAVREGLWARAAVVGSGGPFPRWRQLDGVDRTGARIERGFSGAGAWDAERGGVVGVVAAMLAVEPPDPTRVAWMIPLDVLDGTRFEIPASGNSGGVARSSGGREESLADLWPLVDCLLAMESVAGDSGAALLSLLPVGIASGIPRHGLPRLQLLNIVRRCGDFAEGPAALVRAVQWVEGETIAVERFTDRARRAWPHRFGDDG